MDLNFVAHEYRQKLRSVLSDMTMWYCALATTEHMLHEVTEESELVLVVVVVVFVEFSVVDVPLATDFLKTYGTKICTLIKAQMFVTMNYFSSIANHSNTLQFSSFNHFFYKF